MHEKRFSGEVDRLRSPDRVARLEVETVVARCLEGLTGGEEAADLSVLDVGTGTGLFAESFKKRGCRVAGVDVNPEMVSHARRLVPEAEFSVATAERLPFPDRSFEVVFLGLVFHETDDAEGALRSALRVARTRVAILEWPYKEQEFGPPLAHRVEPSLLRALCLTVAGREPTVIPLTSMELILLEKA